MADRVYRSATFHAAGLPDVAVEEIRDEWNSYSRAVRVRLDEKVYIVANNGGSVHDYVSAQYVSKTYDAVHQTISLVYKATHPFSATETSGDIDLAVRKRTTGTYTLRKRAADNALYVHVKSASSNAEYKVVVNPITKEIESNDKGFIFNGKSKHVDVVKSLGWL